MSLGFLFFLAVILEVAGYVLVGKSPSSLILRLRKSGTDNRKTHAVETGNGRCIITHIEQHGKNCVVFFGSQSGNSQDLAAKIAKEGHTRFGLETMVADLDDYDYDRLGDFPADAVAIFIMASYGDGEPTDNAQSFFETLTAQDFLGHSEKPTALKSMKYASLGLGNSSYAHYNAVIRNVNSALQAMGATQLGPSGEIDDVDNNMEEDFITWKEGMWAAVSGTMQVEERESSYEPTYIISEALAASTAATPQAQQTPQDLVRYNVAGHDDCRASRVAVTRAYNLFTEDERVCLHMDLSLNDTGISYRTGDHLGVLAANPDQEVSRFLRVFGLEHKENVTFEIRSADSISQLPMPFRITYQAAVRHYLDICGPVSRQLISTLGSLVVDNRKEILVELGRDKDAFARATHDRFYNLASFIETLFPDDSVFEVPFAALIDGIPRLRPRFYSISSSSLVQKNTLSITAVVQSHLIPDTSRHFNGVSTNYLFNAARCLDPDGFKSKTSQLNYPSENLDKSISPLISVFVRPSTFKLPQNQTPILMIGAGTGVAPFRGFLQERSQEAQSGEPCGQMTLLYGCRKDPNDFLYKEEWTRYKAMLGDKFTMHIALSRQTDIKHYVQDLVMEMMDKVCQLLTDQGYIFVCGDAKMGQGVSRALSNVLVSTLGFSSVEADQWIEGMRKSHHYQEDVW